ncbi:peptidoglycan-binding protein [Actinomadura syzygii]|uniref:peptidoglycan-binding domain-containing protein n=1 Tax=Actinomadura syzygii TaxID=1427538 RepID=UPI0016522B4D|nr:peptidoglycan-binding domain-containing protein [Actinomadura syzygii]
MAVLTGGFLVGEPATGGGHRGPRLLTQCPEPMELGMQGPCVEDLQRDLRRHGLDLPADGWFGPYTKMRVMAFQALEGLPPSSRVDAATKRAALDLREAPLPRHTPTQIEHRIRVVFSATPDRAVALARCLSNLDPLQVIRYRYQLARWGLFQFSDFELRELGATPATALDAEWNIRTAHAIWKRTRSFRNWNCLDAIDDPRS